MAGVAKICSYSTGLPPDQVREEKETSVSDTQIKTPSRFNTFVNGLKDYVVKPAGYASCASGVFSFLLSSFFKEQNNVVDKLTTLINKISFCGSALYGGLNRAGQKDLFGTSAFALDFILSLFTQSTKLYLVRGFVSALDQVPAMWEELRNNEKIKKIYGENFMPFKGFSDSASKGITVFKTIISDIVDTFRQNKEHGLFKNLKSLLVRSNGNGVKTRGGTAEKNLFLSGLGLIGGSFLGVFLGLERIGGTIRDIFGIHSDYAIFDKGLSKTSSGKMSKSSLNYLISGIAYFGGSALDLIYRWTKIENLHLAALGLDRLAASFYVNAIGQESGDGRYH